MGVKLDDRDPREFGLIFLKDHYHPHTPEMRSKTLIIPGRPGAWDFGSEWGSRPINLPFGIIEYDRLVMQRKIRAFVAFLLDPYGRPREVKLTFDYDPDKHYPVKLAAQISPERLFFAEQFELPLVAHDPYAKSLLLSDQITMGSDISVMADITVGAEYEYTITGSTVIEIINDGTVAVRPDIYIDGTAANIVVWHTQTNKTFFINSITSPIEINGESFTVKVNGANNLNKLNGDFIELLPGSNSLVITPENANLNLRFSFYHKYI
jgi:phage-related protein